MAPQLSVLNSNSSGNAVCANGAGVAARTPAVIVGADADGLGIARSLGKAGVQVVLVDADARRPAMHSRYARPFVIGAMSGPPLIEGLMALRTRLDSRPLL